MQPAFSRDPIPGVDMMQQVISFQAPPKKLDPTEQTALSRLLTEALNLNVTSGPTKTASYGFFLFPSFFTPFLPEGTKLAAAKIWSVTSRYSPVSSVKNQS